jgi:hypothetical protein
MNAAPRLIRRGSAHRLGLRRPYPPLRIAKIVDIQDYGVGEFYAVAGVNGRSWVEDGAHRAVHKLPVVIQPGMIRDLRSPFSPPASPWIKVRGSA